MRLFEDKLLKNSIKSKWHIVPLTYGSSPNFNWKIAYNSYSQNGFLPYFVAADDTYISQSYDLVNWTTPVFLSNFSTDAICGTVDINTRTETEPRARLQIVGQRGYSKYLVAQNQEPSNPLISTNWDNINDQDSTIGNYTDVISSAYYTNSNTLNLIVGLSSNASKSYITIADVPATDWVSTYPVRFASTFVPNGKKIARSSGNYHIVVGGNGYIGVTSSVIGGTWIIKKIGSKIWYGACHNKSSVYPYWVVVGQDGYVLKSTSQYETFEDEPYQITNNSLFAVEYIKGKQISTGLDDGRYIAVGANGVVAMSKNNNPTSADDWVVENVSDINWQNITIANGYCVLGGNNHIAWKRI